LAGLAILTAMHAKATLQLSWSPSPSSSVAGYYLCWGLSSGVYTGTNSYANTTTNATLTFDDTNVYYIAVAAFDSNNVVSQFSNEIMCTNAAAIETNGPPIVWPPSPTNGPTNIVVVSNPPPPPPPPPNNPNPVTNSSGPPVNAMMWGVPPSLGLAVSNALPMLSVAGTVGQMLEIECTTNPASLYSWTVVTNVTVTNIADIAATNPPANPDALDLAFVPGAQQFSLPSSGSNMLFFRAIMPYDYVVLAGQVLPQKGYPARLILVTMPGYSDDACYVTAQSSFIHFSSSSNTFELQSAGSTIRQIATQLSSTLGQNWTTASEFVYTNGMGMIEATVVETEDPSTDPVAQNGTGSQIQINF
jgi:hypothetical protein